MKQHRKVLSLLIIVALIFPFFGSLQQKAFAQANLDIQAKSAILIDAISGKILYEQNADEPLPPASMTKMMTEYLVLEEIATGKLKWDDVVTASDYAHWLGVGGGSRVFLALGEKRTVKELMYAMTVYSANDATVALAEHLAGSETNFVQMMNEKAKELGMTTAHFSTSTGYPKDELGQYAPAVEGETVMSAKDAAILGWHLINDYPESIEFNSTPRIKFREGEPNEMPLPNFNFMLPGLVYGNLVQGVDGIKTGHTSKAGYNFTATAMQNGMRLISVVQGTASEKERFMQTKKLLDYGFANFEVVDLIKAKEKVPGFETAKIEKGKETEVPVVLKKNLSVLMKKGEKDLYKPVVVYNEKLEAPIKSQDRVGYVTFEYTGKEKYTYLNETIQAKGNVDLIAEEDVEKAGAIRLFFRKVIQLIGGIFSGIVDGIKGLF
ncbi:MAG: D-alanyl-D-alanine carboxypeptidase family protein [Tepidibacillus sp.]